MERISAVRAMEWSVELEMALRSKKPGRSVEAILQVGPRIQQWSREPKANMVVCNMFGLVPGEDSLFANAILLRLADAFRLGDKDTRLSVIRVFLSELRNRNKIKKSKPYKGILSKERVHNHVELLERVKIVFDTGDAESRAMVLVLFGCWADFAKESAHIRYSILSSLVSPDILEVKASLFAAGCFCELVGDFALVVLEMLSNIVTSSETSPSARLAGVRVFAKMRCSYSIASRAYKTGLNLLLNSSDEELSVAMLVSLSKLAYGLTLLIADQVDLLLSFLTQKRTLRLQATALRCLHFIVVRQACWFPVHMHVIKTLLTVVDDPELPSTVQCEALQILHKVLLYQLANLPQDDMIEFSHLLTTVESMLEVGHLFTTVEDSTVSPLRSKGILAIQILVDVSTKLIGRARMGSGGDFSHPLPVRIITVVLDWLSLLVKPLLDLFRKDAIVTFQEVQSLLILLLSLVREYPNLAILVLDKTILFIEHIVNSCNQAMGTRQAGLAVHEVDSIREENIITFSSKLVYNVHKFSVKLIENLNEIGAISAEIFFKVHRLIGHVHQCSFFGSHACMIYSILLHSHTIWGLVNKNKEISSLDRDVDDALCNLLVEHEIFSLGCANKMLTERDSWPAYKAGTFAACQGAWVAAAFIFQQLIIKVHSESFSSWLNSLAQFAQSESKIQLFLLPKLASSLADWSREFSIIDEFGQCAIDNINKAGRAEAVAEVYCGLCSSRRALESNVASGTLFGFQIWFLAVRANVIGHVVDLLRVLESIPLRQENTGKNGQILTAECLNSLQQITKLSFELRGLAAEYDLISTSFIGMDSTSSKIISALALSCSLLAFAAGFALFISNVLGGETLTTCSLEISKNCLQGMLIQDLVGRLRLIDREACSNLFLLLEVGRQPKECFHFQPRNEILNLGGEVREILHVCKYAISGILGLQNESKRLPNECQTIMDGLQIVLDTITKWMCIPFQVPKFFFEVRPCVGSELFAYGTDTANHNELLVLPGFHLSLNLCLQLRNVPPDFHSRMTKMYCILYTKASFRDTTRDGEAKEQMQLDYAAWGNDDMIQLNEKLFQYATGSTNTKETGYGKHRDEEASASAFASFEVNDAGQGFSSCLLDVSHFPVGSYRIRWHSCCVDSKGSYWSFLRLNAEPIFNVQKPSVVL